MTPIFFKLKFKKDFPPFPSNLSIPNGIEKEIIWTPALYLCMKKKFTKNPLNFYLLKVKKKSR